MQDFMKEVLLLSAMRLYEVSLLCDRNLSLRQNLLVSSLISGLDLDPSRYISYFFPARLASDRYAVLGTKINGFLLEVTRFFINYVESSY